MRRVVITGIGAVSPAGVGADKLWQGAAPADWHVPAINADDYPEVKGLRRLPVAARWGCLATAEAIRHAGGVADGDSAGMLVGTNGGSAQPIAAFMADARSNGARLVNPILFPDTVMNAVAGHLAIRFGLRGPTATLSDGRLAGMQALTCAWDWLRTGRLTQAVVCGVEPCNPGAEGSTPYQAAEGCGVVVLADRAAAGEHARAEVEAVAQIPRGDVPAGVWARLHQLDLPTPDMVLCPDRLLPPADGMRATDPWRQTGDSAGAASLFAVMAGVRALAEGHRRVWVVEPGERSVTAIVLRNCS